MKAKQPYDFDVAVIGGGSAGYAAARTAADQGLRTVVIEGGDEIGGLCILRGCMPTKALLYAGEILHRARNAQPWGIHTRDVTFDFAKVMARKNEVIRDFAEYRARQLTAGKFEFIRATARFSGPHTLELHPRAKPAPLAAGVPQPSVEPPGQRTVSAPAGKAIPKNITAANFIVATGSRIAPSPLPQLKELGYLDSDSSLKLEALPKSLIVLGGGAVALEFAQFFARFDVKVTLIQRSPHVLHEMDSDVADVIESVFRREGIAVYTGTKLLEARRIGGQKEVFFEQEGERRRAVAEEIFFALGRLPEVASLGMDRIGLQLEYGRLSTNRRMQTAVPHVYAAGDCTGMHEIVHIAVQQGETAALNIAHPGQPREMDYRLLTEVVFTEPQIAAVGLTEKRAHVQNVLYRVAKYPFNDHGKSLIMDAKDGFVKLLADPVTGEIIGGGCVGPMAGELIHEIIAAMAKRMTAGELAVMPHYHPTLAEIWTYPAEELAAQPSG